MFGLPSDRLREAPRSTEAVRSAGGSPARGVCDTLDQLGDDALCGMSVDFGAWLDDENVSWAAFDQFVRTVLRNRLGAVGVRCFHVGRNAQLTPLTEDGVQRLDAMANGERGDSAPISPALLRSVIADRLPYVTRPPNGQDNSVAAGLSPGRSSRWSWLVPIRDADRVCGLVTIARFESCDPWHGHASTPGSNIASALASILSVSWRHVLDIHALHSGLQHDRQSGVLNRCELMARIDRTLEESVRDGEPVMIMGIAVEGLRGLDDAGDFAARDELIAKLGQTLCDKIRTDDVVGRFADDRFIIVLRRLEIRLGRLIAQKLIQTLKTELTSRGDSDRNAASQRTFIRASLAGADDDCLDGACLLGRALGVLDRARRDGIELAIDAPLTEQACQEPASAVDAATGTEVGA
jgi:diguanylate cyclase (GGDEF)-like protein